MMQLLIRPNLSLVTLLFLALAAGDSLSKENEPLAGIIPLPKSTIEMVEAMEGEKVRREVNDFVGVFALPYNAHPGLRHPAPPLGFREEKSVEEVEHKGEKREATRIRWTRDRREDSFANFDARQITLWISDKVAAPEFRMQMREGPDLFLPRSTHKFELLPKAVDPGAKGRDLDELTTLTGNYEDSNKVTIGEQEHTVFRYSYQLRTGKNKIDGELWISETIPGGVYRHSIEGSGEQKGTFSMEVKALGHEALRKDLVKFENGGFAIAIPKGWRKADAQEGEVLRLVPVEADKKLNRAITVELKPAGGKDYEKWGSTLAGDNSKYGRSGSFVRGLADSPTFEIDLWSGSESRAKTSMTGTVRNDRLFLISHWQEEIAPRGETGSGVVEKIVESWRWLQD